LTIKYTFYASDGTHIEATVIGEGMDSGDKGASKALAIGHKYALLQALCLPTEDMADPDSEVQEPSSPKLNEKTNQQSVTADPGEKVFGTEKPKGLLPKGIFTVKAGWNGILRLCDGDKDFAKGLFGKFGAASSKDITYEIYKKVFENLTSGNVNGPESFVDDEIPFGVPSIGATA
jgi:hypothetical protein